MYKSFKLIDKRFYIQQIAVSFLESNNVYADVGTAAGALVGASVGVSVGIVVGDGHAGNVLGFKHNTLPRAGCWHCLKEFELQ